MSQRVSNNLSWFVHRIFSDTAVRGHVSLGGGMHVSEKGEIDLDRFGYLKLYQSVGRKFGS